MKKLLLAILLTITVVMGYAQGLATLGDIASEANASCPTDMGSGLTLQSVALVEKPLALTYTYTVDPNMVNFKMLKNRAAMLHDTKVAEFTTDPANVKLREMCIANGVSVSYIYNTSGDSFVITLTPDDLK